MKHEILHHFSDNQYIKEMRFPAGYSMGKHVHSFSHFSILAQGCVTLKVAGETARVLESPAIIEVAAGKEHEIHFHEDSVWLCTHALTDGEFDTDPEKVDALLIAKGK